MKKTTIITIGYFILTLLFCVGMRLVADAMDDDGLSAFRDKDDEDAYMPYLFRLTEHRIQPAVSIEAREGNSLFVDKNLYVKIEVDFVDNEKDCSIAYPEGIVSVRQNGGRLFIEPSKEFQKKSELYFSPLYNTEGEPDIDYHANDSAYSYSIKHLDGSIKKITEDTDDSRTMTVHIRLKTTRTLLSAMLYNDHGLVLKNMVVPHFKCQVFGELTLIGCKIDNLEVSGDVKLWLDHAKIGKLTLKHNMATDGTYSRNGELLGEKSQVDTLTIAGDRNEYRAEEDMFRTIIVEPSSGESINVMLYGIDKKMVLKGDASSVPMKKVDKEGVKHK